MLFRSSRIVIFWATCTEEMSSVLRGEMYCNFVVWDFFKKINKPVTYYLLLKDIIIIMINQNLIIKRLALIKQLYLIGVNHSYEHESIAAFSILSFHDSIEMFLKLLAENNNVNTDKFNFIEYWKHFPDLTLMESMKNLNARRVSIKHKGLLPSKTDIEISRINTIDFFDQNTKRYFDLNFKDISLLSLIGNQQVKVLLEEAENGLASKNYELCIEKSAVAFDVLLISYEQSKTSYLRNSPFFFGKRMSFNSSFFMGVKDSKMTDFIDNVKSSVEAMQSAIKIISLGLDYKQYVKFSLLTPSITRTMGGDYVAQIHGNRKWTKSNCNYCINFVLNSALKLQEFDFEINEILEDIDYEQIVISTNPAKLNLD